MSHVLNHLLRWNSSPVDWCEPNYVMSTWIAEFYNTISNIPLIILPLWTMKLCWNTPGDLRRIIYEAMILLEIVGISSAYFHSTLCLLGQLLDELSILWVLSLMIANCYPLHRVPLKQLRNRKSFKTTIYTISAMATWLSFWYPSVNSIVLLLITLPNANYVFQEVKLIRHSRVGRLGWNLFLIFSSALTIWLLDRFMCSFWIRIGFPYLHAIFHVNAALLSIYATIFYAYLESVRNIHACNYRLKYWPSNRREFFLPYITEY